MLHLSFQRISVALLGLNAASLLVSSTTAQEEDGSVFELSPFVVDGSEDSGYVAKNTLGGSRLNTRLKDTASAISVFTPDLIEDLGALSIEDVMQYGTNITDSSAYEEATVNGNSISEFDTVFYSRGLPGSRARNYFKWEIASDTFNVERIDQSRGPNSILFGVGSPGGIVNTGTKQAILDGDVKRVKLSLGSWDLFRTELDYNVNLVDEKLAVRLNAMHSEADGWRPNEYDDQDRFHLALKYRPAQKTEIRAELEFGEVSNIKNRPWVGIDEVSAWLDNGAQLRSDSTADASAGIRRIGANYVTYFDATGGLLNMRNTLTSIANPDANQTLILDPSLVAYDNGFAGPGASRDTDYYTYSLFYNQQLLEGLNFEIAFNKQSTDFVSYDTQNNALSIRGNPNAALPDGSTSVAGQLYTEAVWQNRNREREIDTARGSVSYEFEGEKVGRHRMALMYETSDASTVRSENRLYLEGAPFNNNPENGNNMVRMRHHVPIGTPTGFYAVDWREAIGDTFTHTDGNEYPVVWGQRNQNIDDDEESQSAIIFAMQNYFLNDKIVTTFGYRKDEVDIFDRGTVRGDPVAAGKNGWWEVDYDNATLSSFDATTRTYGIVGHLTDRVSIFANKSDNVGVPKFTQNVLPTSTTPDPSSGEGEDYGLHFELLEGKVYATLSYYETAAAGLTAFGTRGNVESRHDRVLDAIVADGGLTVAEADAQRVVTNVYTFDQVAEGYELDLTANLTDSWSLVFNFAKNELVQSNIAMEVEKWWADTKALWDEYSGLSTGQITVLEEAELFENWLTTVQSLDGIVAQGSREHTLRAFTNYKVKDGALKGLNFGGGLRYISGSALGRDSNNNVFYGNSQTMVDLVAGYKFDLSDSVSVRLQLNIKNALDEVDPYFTRTNVAGIVDRLTMPAERNYRLSAAFDF